MSHKKIHAVCGAFLQPKALALPEFEVAKKLHAAGQSRQAIVKARGCVDDFRQAGDLAGLAQTLLLIGYVGAVSCALGMSLWNADERVVCRLFKCHALSQTMSSRARAVRGGVTCAERGHYYYGGVG